MSVKKILLFNPAIGSLNMGDHIILESILRELRSLLENSYVVDISTHLPISIVYMRHFKNFDYKFVCGTNLLRGKMNRLFRQWDINILKAPLIAPVVLIGVGWWQYNDFPNTYTKLLYKAILHKEFYHSVRDSYTENMLKKIGIKNVINTGCPTMWMLTEEHCRGIPINKADNVVCTITDYKKDYEKDKKLIETLIDNYKNVYLWLQGAFDYEYFKNLEIKHERIKIIPPNLREYERILDTEIDYIGTRLHAGIKALQMKKRTIIIGVDNRAIEKKRDFNIPCVERNNMEDLEEVIHKPLEIKIKIPKENIELWKSQFNL